MLGSHTEIQIELSKTIWIILDLAKVVKNPNLQLSLILDMIV